MKLTRLEYTLELISGFMLGVEILDMADIYENEEGWIFMMDLGIFRLILEKSSSVIDV